MMLAGPAAAMIYVNESSGLASSVYGGGGSPSSKSPDAVPSLISLATSCFLLLSPSHKRCCSAVVDDEGPSSGGTATKAGGASAWSSIMEHFGALTARSGKEREEKDGGGDRCSDTLASIQRQEE